MMMSGPSLAWMQKIGSSIFHTWGLKSIQKCYNNHTYLSVIASNELLSLNILNSTHQNGSVGRVLNG